MENLRDANKVYEGYVDECKAAGRSVDLPLFNFVRFLLLTLEVSWCIISFVLKRESMVLMPMSCFLVQRDALPLFQLLQERYAAALSRDAALKNVNVLFSMVLRCLVPSNVLVVLSSTSALSVRSSMDSSHRGTD